MATFLKKQSYYPRRDQLSNFLRLKDLGVDRPEIHEREGGGWFHQRVYHDSTFLLQTVDSYGRKDFAGTVMQEKYIKLFFHISGKTTTVFNGFGEYKADNAQVVIMSCPKDMVKVHISKGGLHYKLVSLCVLRDFFPLQMGIDVDALPEPLRSVFSPEEPLFAIHSMPLSTDIAIALQAVLKGCDSELLGSLYYQTKSIELMCLLIAQAERFRGKDRQNTSIRSTRTIECLHEARDFLNRCYASPLTLQEIARQVGLNKTTLASGFQALFGMSVFDYVQKERMSRAYVLLTAGDVSTERVAEAVGYSHTSSFSTAFSRYYGYSPSKVRS